MVMKSEKEARALLEKVLRFSKADECSLSLSGSAGGNIRYALNQVTTSGAETNLSLGITAWFGKRSGTTTINEFDDASLKKAVRRAEELAKLSPEDPEYVPLLGPQEYLKPKAYFASTANIDPKTRMEAAAASIKPTDGKDLIAAGFLEDSAGFRAIMNSNGLFGYHTSSEAEFTVTVRSEDGTGSGWASRDANDFDRMDTKAASEVAIQKALASRNPQAIEPGKYTVILEPAAVASLVQGMVFSMSARQADEGRSFFSKKGGGTKIGEKIIDERISLSSDPMHALVPGNPWSGGGVPSRKIDWIKDGMVTNLFYDRYWAKQQGVDPTGFPSNGVMSGGEGSTADLIANTKRGILVTRLWYIRSVDRQTLLVTGLTRDGTFFIENGKLKHPIKNLRFNESPIIMLNNVEAMGKPVRTNGSLIPPLKIRDFTFTSLSDAV